MYANSCLQRQTGMTGIADPVPGSTVHTPLVRLAGGTYTNVVGVVENHLLVVIDKKQTPNLVIVITRRASSHTVWRRKPE